MDFAEWEPIYLKRVEEMGFDTNGDDNSVRMLMALTLNSNLVGEDVLDELIGEKVTIFGDSDDLESDIDKIPPEGTLISAGSATERVLKKGIMPHIVVTDLDGDIASQIEASNSGAITVILAHGDNSNLISEHISSFKGPLIITAQGRPPGIVVNYGGFTDGDRAVCIARHFGAKEILMEGFDFENPRLRRGDDFEMSSKKLKWAERIIYDMNPPGIDLIRP